VCSVAIIDDLKTKTDAFLREFFEKGEGLIRELIAENDSLRAQLAATTPDGVQGTERVRELVDRIQTLENELDQIRELAGSVDIGGDYRERLDALELEHYQLACRHVAANQFYSAETVEDVLRNVMEILLNFVGVGEFTIYLHDQARAEFFPVAREGGEVEEREAISAVPDGPMADITGDPGPWREGDDRHAAGAGLFMLPLASGSKLMGVVQLDAFLAQKSGFDHNDFALLELVSEIAGTCVDNAWVRAHADTAPLTRTALAGELGA
jgi:hypothetical protein